MEVHYAEAMYFRLPRGFSAAMAEAATRVGLSRSEFARRAIAQHIERTGVKPPQAPQSRKSR